MQIAKPDELGERSSGLAIEAAMEKLQEESFKLFRGYLTDIKNEVGGRITAKTAADLSASMVVGLMSGIFAKIDPMTVGEDYRSTLIAEEYAQRLNMKGRNLSSIGLSMLVRGYPTHRFVIDRKEASNLFRQVSAPTGKLVTIGKLLGAQVAFPRNHSRNQSPHLEYLNEEPKRRIKVKAAPKT